MYYYIQIRTTKLVLFFFRKFLKNYLISNTHNYYYEIR